MIRLVLVLMATLTLLFSAGGCAGQKGGPDTEQSAGTDQESDKVAQAVAISKEIRANPDAAQSILERHGMTQQQFDALMFEIAEDEGMSRTYAAAMGS